jgi:hypothetical protein
VSLTPTVKEEKMIQPDRKNMMIDMVEQVWDPGGRLLPNHYLLTYIGAILCDSVSTNDTKIDNDDEESRTELYSHANMPVVGRHVLIIEDLDEE